MWCDGFDLDLYALVPSARKVLIPVADVALMTHGRMTDGALEHPSVWNGPMGLMAFFGFEDPGKPASYHTDDPAVPCTFEEVIRDCWVHHYTIMLERRVIWQADRVLPAFDRLMADMRGYGRCPEGELIGYRTVVLDSLAAAVSRLQDVMRFREAGDGAG